MKITSKIHNIHFVRPAGLCFFINFVALLPCLEEPGLGIFPYFFLASTGTIALFTWLYIVGRPQVLVDDKQLVYRTKFPAKQEVYQLKDIVDFQWSGKPVIFGRRSVTQLKLNNEYFTLNFKGHEPLTITFDQYSNFSDIRRFFYNYCLTNDIIEMRPLEERKRSRLFGRRT